MLLNHHFSWENPLQIAIFHRFFVCLPGRVHGKILIFQRGKSMSSHRIHKQLTVQSAAEISRSFANDVPARRAKEMEEVEDLVSVIYIEVFQEYGWETRTFEEGKKKSPLIQGGGLRQAHTIEKVENPSSRLLTTLLRRYFLEICKKITNIL